MTTGSFYFKGLSSIVLSLSLAMSSGCATAAKSSSYADNPKAKLFVDKMVKQGFDRKELNKLMADAKRQDSILKKISTPAERRLTWGEYRKIFLGKKRIQQGVKFWDKHADTLASASKTFGVAPEVIVAIIGVETFYGRIVGKDRVLDALATLAFDYPPRSKFFTGQLEQLLLLAKEERLDSTKLKGSYAGAMGYGQFIPSSYRHYAVDFDNDGQRDILNNPVDAIGSVANYFKQHGWKNGDPVTVKAKIAGKVDEKLFNKGLKPEKNLGQWKEIGVKPVSDEGMADKAVATAMRMAIDGRQEHWLGLHNFYVITRYNHSRLYAMAVHQLSQEILSARLQAADKVVKKS